MSHLSFVSSINCRFYLLSFYVLSYTVPDRVGIKPRFYHNAQPGGFYWFYEGGFGGGLWVIYMWGL